MLVQFETCLSILQDTTSILFIMNSAKIHTKLQQDTCTLFSYLSGRVKFNGLIYLNPKSVPKVLTILQR